PGADALVRHPAAGDDGRDLRLGGADGGHRQQPPRAGRGATDLRLHHRGRAGVHPHRPGGQPPAALLSAGGHRDADHRHRREPDARGHQLDLRQPGRSDRTDRDRPQPRRLAGRHRQAQRRPGLGPAGPAQGPGPAAQHAQPEVRGPHGCRRRRA
ncbi:hypothetical protein KXX11_004310, partial [Aspergillus fumigatus]